MELLRNSSNPLLNGLFLLFLPIEQLWFIPKLRFQSPDSVDLKQLRYSVCQLIAILQQDAWTAQHYSS